MLKFGNKEFLNLEEQVGKNKQDIEQLQTGVKIEKSLTMAQFMSYITEENVGKYYLVTDIGKQYLDLVIRDNEGTVVARNLGEYPRAQQGPQGIPGVKGDKGDTGERGPQGFQGLQGIRGRPGVGWDGLSEIDSTPYDPTYSSSGNFTTVNTIADLVIEKGTPDEDVKQIGLKFEVPRVKTINNIPMYGSSNIVVTTNLWMHSLVLQATDGKITVNLRYLSNSRTAITTLLGLYNFLASTNGELALLTSSFTFNDSSITTPGENVLSYAKTNGDFIHLGRRTSATNVAVWAIGKNEGGSWVVFDTVTQMAPIIVNS